MITQKPLHEVLSDHEYRVMISIASGKSMKNIAKETYLSTSTFSTYLALILENLNLEITTDLIHYKTKNNLID